MNKVFAGLLFFLMSAILYSANVISVSIAKLHYGGQSEVGYSLIVLSIIAFIIGFILLLMAESDMKNGVGKAKERRKSFLDHDLDS